MKTYEKEIDELSRHLEQVVLLATGGFGTGDASEIKRMKAVLHLWDLSRKSAILMSVIAEEDSVGTAVPRESCKDVESLPTPERIREYISYAPEEISEEEYLRIAKDAEFADWVDCGIIETSEGKMRKELHRIKTKQGREAHAFRLVRL